VEVVAAIPAEIRQDLMGDERFRVCDYEPGVGPMQVVMAEPGRGPLSASRCIVLKRTLRQRSADFARYVIAHELAHAHLRHGGRWPGEDPENAADALAAEWGFEKPRGEPRFWIQKQP
jgi:hypothetical protein